MSHLLDSRCAVDLVQRAGFYFFDFFTLGLPSF